MHPELSFQEEKTAAYVSQCLSKWQIDHQKGVGGHGIVALLGDPNKGPVVALRGDMDALPIQEENEVEYRSQNEGVMHACGHDVHTACLLGAARALKEAEGQLKGCVKLIFQPAEERLPGGASIMIDDGVLHKPDVWLIFGQHVYPDMEVGHLGFRPGMYMASADELYIHVMGRGGHAALPQKNVDPILISAHLITAIQQLVSRRSHPSSPTVVSIGKVVAAGSTNVIPKEVYMEGTIRCMDETWRKDLHELLTKLCTELCSSMGGSAEVEIRRGYPCLNNHETLTRWSKKTAAELHGDAHVHDLDLRMTAEDFAYFAQAVPACFYRLGVANAATGKGAPLHTSRFDIDEKALEVGASTMAYLAAMALEEGLDNVLKD